jgi:hypothetical protein
MRPLVARARPGWAVSTASSLAGARSISAPAPLFPRHGNDSMAGRGERARAPTLSDPLLGPAPARPGC